jgi:hypothetical protein
MHWRSGSLAALFFFSLSCGTEAPRARFVLWAWDRPEDLRFLLPGEADVAYLASTIAIDPQGFHERRRASGLKLGGDTRLVATVRIEDRGARLVDDPAAIAELAELIVRHRFHPRVSALQIDFDAVTSERRAYQGLLEAVRIRLPEKYPLTITGLASWCLRDDWTRSLPVDAVIPQLFRMGPESGEVRLLIGGGFVPANPLCARALGVSTDEPKERWETAAVWIFSPKRWTPEAFAKARAELAE